jgi:L-asparagine transporter-like permease
VRGKQLMMSITYSNTRSRDGFRSRKRIEHPANRAILDWRSVVAVTGLAGGVLVVVVGSVLTAISWFVGAGSYVQTLGTVLLFMTIPWLVIGAHCLDLTEEKNERAKQRRFECI